MGWSNFGGVVDEKEKVEEEVEVMGMGLVEYIERDTYTTWYSTAYYIHYSICPTLDATCHMDSTILKVPRS